MSPLSRIFSRRFTSASLVWVPGHCDIPGNCKADELARTLLPESSSIELGMPLSSVKLAIARKYFRDANLSWVNEESFTTARLTWPLMDRRNTNQLLRLGRDWSSLRYGRHEQTMRLPFNDFYHGCPSLARCRYMLFGSPFLVSLTELSFIDIKDIASFIKLSG